MNWQERLTANLESLLEATKIASIPEQLRTAIQRQEVTVETKSPRCERCAGFIMTLYPAGGLCGNCIGELREIDRREIPEAKWFREFVEERRQKQQ